VYGSSLTAMIRPVLQFEVRKYEWNLNNLEDIVKQVGFTFETVLSLTECELTGTNHLEKTGIWTDGDLTAWLESQQENKLLKVRVPRKVLPETFRPGEAPILSHGKVTAAFDGDGRADQRTIDFQLRIFDCGHFYMKQSLRSTNSGMPPNWVIFEGRWRRSERGYRLEIFLRYPRSSVNCAEFVIHGLPGRNMTSLNFSGDEELVLKGFLPTVVVTGTAVESTCWAALTRNHDNPDAPGTSVGRIKSGTQNQEDEEAEEAEEEEEEEDEDQFSPNQKHELVQSLMKELKPEQQHELQQALGQHGMSPELYSGLSPPLRQALQRLQRRATVQARRMEHASEGEPTWPMYLGLGLFVFVFVVFAYLWYEEHFLGEKLVDIDEDDYWKTDNFF